MRKVLFLFGQLNDNDVEWLLAKGTKRFVPAGGVLIEQGIPVEALFILLEGSLAVWLKNPRGQEQEIAHLNAGEIVGEMSFVDARPPSATVRAREDSNVFVISKSLLNAKLGSDLGFAARFYRALAIYLSTTVRERHRSLSYSTGAAVSAAEQEEYDDTDDLDPNVLDGVYLAGERFSRMVRHFLSS